MTVEAKIIILIEWSSDESMYKTICSDGRGDRGQNASPTQHGVGSFEQVCREERLKLSELVERQLLQVAGGNRETE